MQADAEYLKNLLAAFQEAPSPTTDINELQEKGLSQDDPRFLFQMLLHDEGYVVADNPDVRGIGISASVALSVIPLRPHSVRSSICSGYGEQ